MGMSQLKIRKPENEWPSFLLTVGNTKQTSKQASERASKHASKKAREHARKLALLPSRTGFGRGRADMDSESIAQRDAATPVAPSKLATGACTGPPPDLWVTSPIFRSQDIYLGLDSPFCSTIVLSKNRPFSLRFRWFSRKTDPWKECNKKILESSDSSQTI